MKTRIDLDEYIGWQIPKPKKEHVGINEYLRRIRAAGAGFDYLAKDLQVVRFNGDDPEQADYKVYAPVDLGEHDLGDQIRGLPGERPVFASFVYRLLNPDPAYRNEQRQINLWAAGKLIGAHSIESGHTYVTTVNDQKLDKFNSLVVGISQLRA